MSAAAPVTPDSAVARHDAPLIPDFLWRWMGPIIGALTVVVVGLAILTSRRIGPFGAEQTVIDALRGSTVPHPVWTFGLALGGARFFGVVVVALAAWAIARRSWPALVACATVPGAVLVVEQILKPIVHRQDAFHDALYYPSGTAAGVAAWATLVWLLAVPLISSARLRLVLALGLGALTILTAMAVIGSNKHLPLDTVGGIAAGMGIVLACASLIDRVTGAHRTERAGVSRG